MLSAKEMDTGLYDVGGTFYSFLNTQTELFNTGLSSPGSAFIPFFSKNGYAAYVEQNSQHSWMTREKYTM